ncbi:MAG TPA: cupin domain-containing protein [Longimicrobiales bacterium]
MSDERSAAGTGSTGAAGVESEGAVEARSAACGGPAVPVLDRSRILRHDGAGWVGVRALPYREPVEGGAVAFRGITRRVLAAPAAAAFDVRYFEIDPDGHSALERHAHVHVVVCYRGRGRVRLGDALHDVGYGDVIYVAPDEPHQFLNPHTEPFGFLRIVDRERDRPEPIGG